MGDTMSQGRLGMTYNIRWAEGSNCVGAPTDLFFDFYESSAAAVTAVERMCNTCPLQRECLSAGVSRNEWGVWGGIYLQDGEISDEFNAHNTPDDWNRLWMRLTTLTK